jgi:hypothetical protein
MIQHADFDCAIVVGLYDFNVYLARVPDLEVLATIEELKTFPGVKMHDASGLISPYEDDSFSSSISKSERCRLHYSLSVPPVYDLQLFAQKFAMRLSELHEFRVRCLFDVPPEDEIKTQVFAPRPT